MFKTSGLCAALASTFAFAGACVGAEAQEPACGPSALSMAAQLVKRRPSEAQLASAFEGPLGGERTFVELERAARYLGLATLWWEGDVAAAATTGLPAIVALRDVEGLEAQHFVVVCGGDRHSAQVLDYPAAPRGVDAAWLDAHTEPIALLIASDPAALAPYRPRGRGINGIVGAAGAGTGALATVLLVLSIRRGHRRPISPA